MKKLYIVSVICSFCLSSAFAQENQDSAITSQSTDSAATISSIKPEIDDATIMAMIDGLINTPLYDNPDRIANLTHMFVQWVIETNKVTIEILPYFNDITKTNKALSIPFFCGWVKYSHDNEWKKSDFPLEENISAIASVIEYYKKNEDKFLKDDYVIELNQKHTEGKLNDFIAGEINFSKTISDLINSDINDRNKKTRDSKSKTLFVVNKKEVSKAEFSKINSQDIAHITVVKGDSDIKKYTNRECDSIVVVRLKEK